MASPLTVRRNDYHAHPKSSTVYTPVGVAQFLFDVLQRPAFKTVLDPAIGSGRLTDPWHDSGHFVIGIDIEDAAPACDALCVGRFEDLSHVDVQPDLVLCNGPFNGAPGKQLYPEVFLAHTFKLFGPAIPTVMFTPMGFRLNQRRKSKRWRWLRDCKARITSIISLPLDTFPGVEFHAEILIFNVDGIEPHYFLPEKALQ